MKKFLKVFAAAALCMGIVATSLSYTGAIKEIKAEEAPLYVMACLSDLHNQAEIITEPLDEVTVKLYFSNGDSTGLDVEVRRIIVNPNQELGGYVLTELIKGPVDENLKPTVPPETKVLDLKVLDGVCYVDLSSDFVTKHSGGTSEELLTIYSIVNSLTSIEGIDKVQFLIEGEKQTTFKGGVDFSIQFTAKDLYL